MRLQPRLQPRLRVASRAAGHAADATPRPIERPPAASAASQLHEAGAALNQTNDMGGTPLFSAVYFNDESTVHR